MRIGDMLLASGRQQHKLTGVQSDKGTFTLLFYVAFLIIEGQTAYDHFHYSQ